MRVSPIVCLLVITSSPSIVLGAGDPERVDLLYISRWACYRSRFDKMMDADPSINVLGVPMPDTFSMGKGYIDAEDLNRRMRIYMPRTMNQMLSERDIVVMHDAPLGHYIETVIHFDPKWISWFVKGVQDEGMSFGMWGGDASWGAGGEGEYPSWGDTMLDAILPYSSLPGYNPYAGYGTFKRTFSDPYHPLARIPWKETSPIELLNRVTAKDGSTTIAEAVSGDTVFPWIAWWRSGKGKVVGETEVFGSQGTTTIHDGIRRGWTWYQDFLIYLVYYAVDKPIPEDVYRAHRLRGEINLHAAKASLMISLLDFVEGFGASTLSLRKELDAINVRESEAEELYRRDEYDMAAQIFEEMDALWTRLDSKAARAKERALAWVFLVEWFIVTGTAMGTGVMVWMLMLRRKLYREAGATRFSSA